MFIKKYIIRKALTYFNKKDSNVQRLSHNSEMNFINSYISTIEKDSLYMRYIRNVKKLLTVYDVENGKMVRIGNEKDGGYVLLDDFDHIKGIYGFGVGDNIDFEYNFADRMDVFLYDHTVEELPRQHDIFRYYKKGVAGINDKENDIFTLKQLMKENGHDITTVEDSSLILKMDVEGYEYDALLSTDTKLLKSFDQIVMELHFLLDYYNRQKLYKVLNKLNCSHKLIHVHANNAEPAIYTKKYGTFPNLIELTYVRNKNRNFRKSDKLFPTQLDMKNVSYYPDIDLGKWNLDI